ncbi:MAG: SDR family NAD(P)-dependent oxidoreductase, partial [Bacteroidota bacterium]
PQTRLMHQQVYLALEDASIDPYSYGGAIGLYLSPQQSYDWVTHLRVNPNEGVDSFLAYRLADSQFMSTLISYKLNLMGPSMVLDTACSSSLTAIHVACRNLLLRECQVAVAGGVSLGVVEKRGYQYREGMVMSRDGRCKPFDKESSGIISGEGAGVVVLKRMEEALKDGDPIYAVIKASAVNNDGNRKVGYTAPSVVGQSKCISTAYQFANLDPLTVTYIEAHGTGTQLGDPVEIAALNKVFKNNTDHSCAIGSVKSNMGHLDTAAGVAGFIKAALTVRHREIPPTLHYQEPNPGIDFEGGPFYVNPQLEPWQSANGQPFRAGVSSLGIGGTNAHIVLEEVPRPISGTSHRRYQLLTYSAKSTNSLTAFGEKLGSHLQDNTTHGLPDLAFSTHYGRASHNVRDFVVCESLEQGAELLQQKTNQPLPTAIGAPKRLVFMFPGQGSQYHGMAKDLYEDEPYFASVMDEGFAILKTFSGTDFKELLGYNSSIETPDERLHHTQYTQPALFLVQYALASTLQHWGLQPDAMIGHSLGEFTAACLADVFSFEDGLKILTERARLMSSVPEGDMIAIGATAEEVKEYMSPELSIAAVNTVDACTISGTAEAIGRLKLALDEVEIPNKILTTSHAFHSEMMDPILPAFENFMKLVTLSAPNKAFISNDTGDFITAEMATDPAYWTRHLRQTVRYEAGLDTLLDDHGHLFIEVGPGKALSSFAKGHPKFKKSNDTTIQLLGHPKLKADDALLFTRAIGQLWQRGATIDWDAYHEKDALHKVRIPTYVFEEHSFRARIRLSELYSQLGLIYQANAGSQDALFYVLNWKKSIQQKKENTKSSGNCVLFSDGTPLSDELEKVLETAYDKVVKVSMGDGFRKMAENVYELDPFDGAQFTTLFHTLSEEKHLPEQVVFTWSTELSARGMGYESLFEVELSLCKSLIELPEEHAVRLAFVGRNYFKVLGHERTEVEESAALSVGLVAAQEHPALNVGILDVGDGPTSEGVMQQLLQDLTAPQSEAKICYRNGQRWVSFYESLKSPEMPANHGIEKDKNYLITGGLGPVGAVLTAHLCDTYQARVIVVGRSEMPDVDTLTDTSGGDLKHQIWKAHRDAGRNVVYHTADLTDKNKFMDAITSIEDNYGPIAGIIHAAGNSDHETFKSIEDLDRESIDRQFAPKVTGTRNLHEIAANMSLDFVWITSSISTVLGGLTYGAYVGANSFLDAFYAEKYEELRNWYCVNLDGLSVNGMSPEQLVQTFESSFQLRTATPLIVSSRDLQQRIDQQKEKTEETESGSEEENEVVIARPQIQTDFVAPETETEEAMCQIWQDFFGYDQLGIEDDFFELGGDSLKAMTIVKRINKAFESSLSLKDFFQKATIRQIASEIEMIKELQNIQTSSEGRKTIKI